MNDLYMNDVYMNVVYMNDLLTFHPPSMILDFMSSNDELRPSVVVVVFVTLLCLHAHHIPKYGFAC